MRSPHKWAVAPSAGLGNSLLKGPSSWEQERRRLSIVLSQYKDGAGQVGWALGNRGCSWEGQHGVRSLRYQAGIYPIPQIFDLEEPVPIVNQNLSVSGDLLKFRQDVMAFACVHKATNLVRLQAFRVLPLGWDDGRLSGLPAFSRSVLDNIYL